MRVVKCSDIMDFMEQLAPKFLAEEWDNTGLIVGNPDSEVRNVMLCLDITGKVVQEAVDRRVDMIISHHPLIFKSLRSIRQNDPKGRALMELIKNEINVYSAHTNLDFAVPGINEYLAEKLGLKDIRALKTYKSEKMYKLAVFVPEKETDVVREAMGRAGAGWIGNYSDCFFITGGTGTFKPLEGTNPYIGERGRLERVAENRIETIVPASRLEAVIKAMLEVHPYEEVAYDIYPLEVEGKAYGMGRLGFLPAPLDIEEFIAIVKDKLDIKNLRLIGNTGKKVEIVAVFCGSFDDDITETVKKKAEILITGDVKYHTAVELSEEGLCVIDAGHFNTERIILPRIAEFIQKSFPGVTVNISTMEEDPFKYY